MWKTLGRLRSLEWAINKVVLIVSFAVVVMSAAITWVQELSLLWQVVVFLGLGLAAGLITASVQALWKKWRLAHAPTQEEPEQQSEPTSEPHRVIPIKYGKRGYEQGLFLKNVSNDPVYDVTVETFDMGHLSVSWGGPEVTFLEAGNECFFYPVTEGTPCRGPLNDGPSGFFILLRNWQSAINDLGAEVEGIIRYVAGGKREVRYRIGVDVLNKDSGLVVRVVHPQP